MSIIVDPIKIVPPVAITGAAAVTQSVFQTTAGGNLILNAPGSGRLNGQQFYLQASGIAFGGPGTYTATIQPILYGDASLATVTTKPLFSATAGTLAYTGTVGGAIPWTMWAQLEGDTTSGLVFGAVQSQAGATLKAETVSVATVSAINFNTEPPIKFAVGMTTVGTLGAAAKITITQFNLYVE